MPTRTQKDKDFIISNLEETYFIESFVTKQDITQLIDSWHQSKNKVYKKTGPVTSNIENHDTPVLDKIKKKIKE